jgi:hypothetical protein
MWRIPLFAFDRARWIGVVVLLVTIASFQAARVIRVDVSGDVLIPSTGRERAEWARTRALFGGHEPSAVYAEDPRLFSPRMLARLRDLHDRLAALPTVAKVESLFNLPDIRNEGTTLETGASLAVLPATSEAATTLRDRVTANPLLTSQVVSRDGQAMLFLLYLNEQDGALDASVVTGRICGLFVSFSSTGEFDRHFGIGPTGPAGMSSPHAAKTARRS